MQSSPDYLSLKDHGCTNCTLEPIFLTELEAGTAPADEAYVDQINSVLQQETALNSVGDLPGTTCTSNQQPAKTAQTANEASTVRKDPSTDSPRHKERLDWASKAFKGIEMVSGTIPIIGGYVGAAAKVGVACVELAQLAGKNEEEANVLGSRTTRLSEILRQFNGRPPNDDQIGTTRLIQELQKFAISIFVAGA
ncbi:hypothetical protein FRC00_007807 [Tulasnella sp. 408]|nr:hypothetical protein FRC00_007807 [Tulasnella sp. 408]